MPAIRHALLIGINGYPETSGLTPLKYAEADAQALAEVLARAYGFQTRLLLGGRATRDAVEEALLAAGKGDTFLFFFAGHGQMIRGQYKLHPADSTAAGLRTLAFSEIATQWQTGFGYERVLAILDACRSELGGTRGGRGLEATAARDIGLATQGERLVEILYGCSEGEVSYEVEELGHGLLTRALLEVLGSPPRELDTHTLAGAAADWLVDWAGKDPQGRRQHPHRYYSPSLKQRIVLRDEPIVVLPPAPAAAPKVKCPACGIRNPVDDTFECQLCHRDHLCLDHLVKARRCCEECAAVAERQTREQAENAERERQALAEAAAREKAGAERKAALTAARLAEQRAELVRRAQQQEEEAARLAKRQEALGDLKEVPETTWATIDFAALAPGSREAHERQEACARELDVPVEVEGRFGMRFRLIPPGEFVMGSPDNEADRSDDEGPHRVKITQPFWLGRFPVTQTQWQAVMGNNPSSFSEAGPDAPVEKVSWDDCQGFIQKLTTLTRSGGSGSLPQTPDRAGPATLEFFRLPTEAEWEYACRAGTTTPFCYGDSLDASQANFDGNYPYGKGKKGQYRETTTPVGSFKPDGFGLDDMHGNVLEWCADRYGAYPKGDAINPTGPAGGSARVLRGGSWFYGARICRSASRLSLDPTARFFSLGFRVVCSPRALCRKHFVEDCERRRECVIRKEPAPSDFSGRFWTIVNQRSGKCLDVCGGGLENGVSIIQFSPGGESARNQQWQLVRLDDGDYRIESRVSGLCLDVRDSSQEDGAAIIQYRWHGGPNQRWRIRCLAEDRFRIEAKHNGMCLDVPAGHQEDGAGVILSTWREGENGNQRWRLEPVPEKPTPAKDISGRGWLCANCKCWQSGLEWMQHEQWHDPVGEAADYTCPACHQKVGLTWLAGDSLVAGPPKDISACTSACARCGQVLPGRKWMELEKLHYPNGVAIYRCPACRELTELRAP